MRRLATSGYDKHLVRDPSSSVIVMDISAPPRPPSVPPVPEPPLLAVAVAVAVPPGSIAAQVRALPLVAQVPGALRDSACQMLRLSRARAVVECDALAHVFQEELPPERRTLILDLLASAGTPEAQLVMRRLLSLDVARRDRRSFAAFVQRLGFVERPDAPTLRFLIGVYADTRGEPSEVRGACAFALGAAAGRAYVWGLGEAAVMASDILRHDLLEADAATDKCMLLTALGHAGIDTDVPLVLRFVADDDARVRTAAVLGLRRMHTPDAKRWLLDALGGKDPVLAENALSALFEHLFAEDELVRLAELVLAGSTPLALDRRILRLIATQKLSGMSGAPVIESAVRLMLGRLEAPARGTLRSVPPPPRVRLSGASGSYVAYVPDSEPPAAEARRSSAPPRTRSSASDALRACTAEPTSGLAPQRAAAELPEPAASSEVRVIPAVESVAPPATRSAYHVACPVVPLTVVR